jgi:hypothetical protein
MRLGRDPRAAALIPPTQPGHVVPVGTVPTKSGFQGAFHWPHFLAEAQKPEIAAEVDHAFIAGALLTLGDELSRHRYFDRAPELELVRHLRNGVAHGNPFEIRQPAQLAKYPAHYHAAASGLCDFDVTPSHHGQPVRFDFMEAGDVIALLGAVGVYLIRMGNGEPLRR